RTLVNLAWEGTNIDRVTWFYYDHDRSRDGEELQIFFITDGKKIVTEQVRFLHCEPLILKKRHDDDPIWRSDPYFDEAWATYWYRKFYSEMVTGQLMVLRPDEPRLYYFVRAPLRDVARDVQLVTLLKMYR